MIMSTIIVDEKTNKILTQWAKDEGFATLEGLLRFIASEYAQTRIKSVLKGAKGVVNGMAELLGIEDKEKSSGMTVLELVQESNKEAILTDGFEDALIGIVEQFGHPPVALYDREKCLEILMEQNGISDEEVEDFFEFNIIRVHAGKNIPAYATIPTTE